MNKEAFPHVGETMYHQVMENGLNVFVFPKPEFQKGYAFFATNYGGMDRRFCLDGVWHDTPAGVAHYLEHKMFDTEDGNALQELAANGASPNAFTSSAITGYYFESTEKFHENLRTLYACHKAFYDPANMVLCVAGNVDPEQVCAMARDILPKQAGPIAEKDYGPAETDRVAQSELTEEMEVSIPLFQLGYKGDAPQKGEAGQRQELVAELALEALLGSSSPLYAKLYQQGLINRSFSYGYESYPGCSFLCAGGESKDPRAVRDAVAAEAVRLCREGIDGPLWQRIKKGAYGAKVRGLNSFENLCIGQAQAFFAGSDYLRFADLFAAITRQEAQDLIARWVTPERTALAVIRPKGEVQ